MQLSMIETPVERFSLRQYQIDFLNELYSLISDGHTKICCCAPTGSGKTVLMAQIAEHATQRGRRVLIIVDRDVLVSQTFDKLKHFGLHHQTGFIKAGWPTDKEALVQIASTQSMLKRKWWHEAHFDLVVYDEAHTTLFSKAGQKVRYETHPDAIILAFTATPYRLSAKQGLGDHLDVVVSAPPPRKLQELGMLAPMKYYGLATEDQIDLGDVRTVAGDYSEKDLKNACDRPHLIQRIVDEWHRLTPGKRTVAFCVGVEHAEHVAEAFNRAGVPSASVDGGTPIKERERLYTALKDGDLLVLTSCNVISIGFDEPSVEVGLLLRPTQSRALHHQQIGRVMRISPATGKEHGMILDQAGNLVRLGFPEDVEQYTLTTGKDQDEPGICPKKQCPGCNSILYSFEMVCASCGHEFERTIKALDTELVELAPAAELKHIKLEAKLKRAYQVLLRKGFSKGYDPAWAGVQFKQKFGTYPKAGWAKGAIFGDNPTTFNFHTYLVSLTKVSGKKQKNFKWVMNQYLQEFGTDNADAIAYLNAALGLSELKA